MLNATTEVYMLAPVNAALGNLPVAIGAVVL